MIPIPLDLLEPHPKLMLRFVYEIVALAALIRAAVSQDTPNGQLEPGRVVPRKDGKKGYLVYIGVRRYLALKWLFEQTHDPRFAVFYAYVDAGLTELQMFVRAKMENEEGKGERQGLSVLEEVFGLHKIRDSVSSPEKMDADLKREFQVAERTNEERLRKLFRVESATRFRFTLPHLERLCAIGDERDFYLSAACAAGFNIGADRVEEAVEGKNSVYLLEWFKRLFPEYKEPEKKMATAAAPQQPSSSTTESGKGDGRDKADTDKGQEKKRRLEKHKKAAVTVPCPACKTEKIVQLELKVLIREIPLDPRKTGSRGVPDGLFRYFCECDYCPRKFYAFVEPLGGRRYGAEASTSSRFRQPKRVVEAVDLRADYDDNVWQKVVEGRVVGTTTAARRTEAEGE